MYELWNTRKYIVVVNSHVIHMYIVCIHVIVNGDLFSKAELSAGVPQDAVLDHLLFATLIMIPDYLMTS